MKSSGPVAGASARFVWRVRFVAAGFVLIALIIISRLYFLQIMHGRDYAVRADRQFTSPAGALFDRGSIYFTTKEGERIAAATLQLGVLLAVHPREVEDAEALWQKINAVVPLDRDAFIEKATRTSAQYVVVAERLTSEQGAKLQALKLKAIEVNKDRWRFYPGGSMASQALGFVAYNENVREGRYGLERYYEPVLARGGEDLYANFFVALFANVKNVLSGQEQGDIVTTIEPSVQSELERQLARYQDKWHPKESGGIIMDPKTGAIYAMALTPNFDINYFNKEKNARIFANPLVENDYEMGSIMKPLTMAAGLDSGVVTPNTTYNDTGCMTLNTAKICNFDGKARGVIPMQQVLSQSLNLGASFVAAQLGPERMRDYFLDRYKISSETGIDLPGEVPGLVNNLQSPREVEYATASFGQGIAITPIATVRALATLGNGGYLVTPHLAKAVIDSTGLERPLGWAVGEKVLKDETSLQISRMLTEVVDEALVGGDLKLEHWSVAAKTGTAQIADPAGGGYYADRYLHSFFGYFPSFDARFIIFLYAFEPTGAQYSSQTWAVHFKDLTQFLINYYDIPPDR